MALGRRNRLYLFAHAFNALSTASFRAAHFANVSALATWHASTIASESSRSRFAISGLSLQSCPHSPNASVGIRHGAGVSGVIPDLHELRIKAQLMALIRSRSGFAGNGDISDRLFRYVRA